METQFREIAIERVLPNPEQPRGVFAEDELQGLAESIRAQGVIQPIVVEEMGIDFILHDGERRLRAARLAGLATVPAIVRPPLNGSGQLERLLRALAANVQRADLRPAEEGRAYRRLQDELGLSGAEIARQMGVSYARVQGRLLLTELEHEIQALIDMGKLHRDGRLATALLDIPEPAARVQLAQSLAERDVKLMAAIRACKRVQQALKDKQALQAQPVEDPRPPMERLARAKAADAPDLPEWDALFQVGKVPPWPAVSEAAMKTCDGCGLRSAASEATCGQCPAVEMLRGMLENAKRLMS